jgi:hypothetical protein
MADGHGVHYILIDSDGRVTTYTNSHEDSPSAICHMANGIRSKVQSLEQRYIYEYVHDSFVDQKKLENMKGRIEFTQNMGCRYFVVALYDNEPVDAVFNGNRNINYKGTHLSPPRHLSNIVIGTCALVSLEEPFSEQFLDYVMSDASYSAGKTYYAGVARRRFADNSLLVASGAIELVVKMVPLASVLMLSWVAFKYYYNV